MDRICPFLALSTDHRTVVDGFDPDHACHALPEVAPLDRSRQAEQCLTEAHRQCERYLAFLASRAADTASVPAPSADALIRRTRLVMEPELRRGRDLAAGGLGQSPRRWLVAGGVAAVGVAAAATAFGGGFNGLVGRPSPSGSAPGPSTAQGEAPSLTPQATAEPTAQPTAEVGSASAQPAAATATAQPSPSAAASAPATPTTYVVQAGDTLSLIATRFGTSVTALQETNGMNSDVINIGEVLVIP